MQMAKESPLPKLIEILLQSTPTDPMFGFGDPISVFAGSGEKLGTYEGSGCPNGFKILSQDDLPKFRSEQILRNVKIGDAIFPYIVMWDSAYGKLERGTYDGQVVFHQRKDGTGYGKCILIKGGAALPSVIPRRKYNWLWIMKEIFLHPSETDVWRGSAGCPTVKRSQYPAFIANFKDPWIPEKDPESTIKFWGEKVKVVVR